MRGRVGERRNGDMLHWGLSSRRGRDEPAEEVKEDFEVQVVKEEGERWGMALLEDLRVQGVLLDSPAQRAGVAAGYTITAVNSIPVCSVEEATKILHTSTTLAVLTVKADRPTASATVYPLLTAFSLGQDEATTRCEVFVEQMAAFDTIATRFHSKREFP